MVAQGYTLRQIAAMKGYPGMALMLKWYAEKPEFRQKIEKAKTELVERFAEDILDIADDASNDYMVRLTGSGKEYKTVDHENVQRLRYERHSSRACARNPVGLVQRSPNSPAREADRTRLHAAADREPQGHAGHEPHAEVVCRET
jgi:hypothetical protein